VVKASLLTIAITALIAGLAACSKDEPIKPGDPVAGKKIYNAYCAACHQADGTGKTASGVRLAADYTLADGPLSRPDNELIKIIIAGKVGDIGSMPAWRGVLGKQEPRDVLAHLRTSFAPPPQGD